MRIKPWIGVLTVCALAMLPVAAKEGEGVDLTDPSNFTETAPESFNAQFETSAGTFVIEVTREWAPNGADRFYNLVKSGFYDEQRFFRVLSGFVVQWGMSGDPAVTAVWKDARIDDDPANASNDAGTITFAKPNAPNARTTQVFINLNANKRLDQMGFAPFGKVVEGMDVVEKLFAGYGEGAPRGKGPSQGTIGQRGNEYLKADFPDLDFIKKASIAE